MKKAFLFLVLIIFFISCKDDNKKQNISYKIGDEITLKSYNNKSLTLIRTDKGFKIKNNENKIIIFDLFGTFCPPCKEEAPYLSALQNEFKDEMTIVALAYFEKKNDTKIKEFAKTYHVNYFITNDNNGEPLIDIILNDINYPSEVLLPFKVVLYNGNYQILSDKDGNKNNNFYLGKIPTNIIKEDIKNILNKK